MTFLSSPFNFLAMFVCLFEFWFFFSWFHWWIWSISSLPCQWKTHQPFVQADIPVSIICAQRLHLLLGFLAQGYHSSGVLSSLKVDFSNRLFRHGNDEQMDTRRGETALSQLQNNLKLCCLQELSLPHVGQLRAERGVVHSSFSHTSNERPLLNSLSDPRSQFHSVHLKAGS